MSRLRINRGWAVRLGGAVLIGVFGFVASVLLDLEPQPWAYAVMVLLACSAVWLLIDTVDTPPARWLPALPSHGDRNDEVSNDLRILSSTRQPPSRAPPCGIGWSSWPAVATRRCAEALHAELDPGPPSQAPPRSTAS